MKLIISPVFSAQSLGKTMERLTSVLCKFQHAYVWYIRTYVVPVHENHLIHMICTNTNAHTLSKNMNLQFPSNFANNEFLGFADDDTH